MTLMGAGGLTEEEILAFQTKLANGVTKPTKVDSPAWGPLNGAAMERNGNHVTATSSGNRSSTGSDED